jgi:hypothetical protein
VIERESGADRLDDIRGAIKALKRAAE